MSEERDTEIWYAGLPVTGRRPLTAAERARATAWMRLRATQAALSLLFVPALLAGLAAVLRVDRGLAVAGAFAGAMVAILLFRPVSRVRRYGVQTLQLLRDLRQGEAVSCSGRRGDVVFTFESDSAMSPVSMLLGDPADQISVEALPCSGAVLSLAGVPSQSFQQLSRGETAAVPEHARRAADFVKPIETEKGTVYVHQRPMSTTELAELGGYVGGLTVPAIVAVALVNVLALASWYVALSGGAASLLFVAVTTFGALAADSRVMKVIRRRMRFGKDLATSAVVIVRSDGGEAKVDLGPPREYLPHSRVLWTDGGLPAAWRRIGVRRPTYVRR